MYLKTLKHLFLKKKKKKDSKTSNKIIKKVIGIFIISSEYT